MKLEKSILQSCPFLEYHVWEYISFSLANLIKERGFQFICGIKSHKPFPGTWSGILPVLWYSIANFQVVVRKVLPGMPNLSRFGESWERILYSCCRWNMMEIILGGFLSHRIVRQIIKVFKSLILDSLWNLWTKVTSLALVVVHQHVTLALLLDINESGQTLWGQPLWSGIIFGEYLWSQWGTIKKNCIKLVIRQKDDYMSFLLKFFKKLLILKQFSIFTRITMIVQSVSIHLSPSISHLM